MAEIKTAEPGYMALYRSGDLKHRTEALEARLSSCDICPRECGVNRLRGEYGFCRTGYLPLVASACAHLGEEPAISGTKGSGTIFFGSCNLKCVYCQNYQISQDRDRKHAEETNFLTLAEKMLYLQEELGCHNINLVSPTQFAPQILRGILEAVPMGLKVPLVYNSNGYDSVKTLSEMEGIIDIYLPDLRYGSDKWARKYSQAPNYVAAARAAILEMHRQVGNLVVDNDGLARKGLIVRHLILPNGTAGSRDTLTWMVESLTPEVAVSVMSQYYPAHHARRIPNLSRHITKNEYSEVVKLVEELGLENGWIQEMGASENYLPDFARKGHPFDSDVD